MTAAARLDKIRTMTTWRYVASRVRDQTSDEESWEIRELFYEEDGGFSFTEQAIASTGNTIEELQRDLDAMLRDSQQQPHLDPTAMSHDSPTTARRWATRPDGYRRCRCAQRRCSRSAGHGTGKESLKSCANRATCTSCTERSCMPLSASKVTPEAEPKRDYALNLNSTTSPRLGTAA